MDETPGGMGGHVILCVKLTVKFYMYAVPSVCVDRGVGACRGTGRFYGATTHALRGFLPVLLKKSVCLPVCFRRCDITRNVVIFQRIFSATMLTFQYRVQYGCLRANRGIFCVPMEPVLSVRRIGLNSFLKIDM